MIQYTDTWRFRLLRSFLAYCLCLVACPMLSGHADTLQVELDITKAGEGALTPGLGISLIEANTIAEVYAQAEAGWRFAQWDGDLPSGQRLDNPLLLMMDQDRAIKARFVPDPAPLYPQLVNTNGATDQGDDTNVQVVTNDKGVWLAVWSSTENLGGVLGTDRDLLCARFNAASGLWSNPTPVNSYANSDIAADSSFSLATDKAGTWMVVWSSSHNPDGIYGDDSDLFMATSTDNGLTWSPALPVNNAASDGTYADSGPCLAYDSGTWGLAWRKITAAGGDIVFAKSSDMGAVWSTPVNVASTERFYPIGIAVNGTTWRVLGQAQYTDYRTNHAIYRAFSSNDNGVTWPENRDFYAAATYYTNFFSMLGSGIKYLGDDTWLASVAVGYVYGLQIYVYLSDDNGATWQQSELTTFIPFSGPNSSTMDPSGEITLYGRMDVNVAGGSKNARITSTDGGQTWSDPVPVSDAESYSTDTYVPAISVSSDVHGRRVVTWPSKEQFPSLHPGGIGVDYDLLFTYENPYSVEGETEGDPEDEGATEGEGAIEGGLEGEGTTEGEGAAEGEGAFDPVPGLMNSYGLGDAADDSLPSIAHNGAGTWLTVWSSNHRSDGSTGTSRIMSAHSYDGGATWDEASPVSLPEVDASSFNLSPHLASDGESWFLVWISGIPVTEGGTAKSRVVFATSSDDGLSWSSPVALADTHASWLHRHDRNPRIAAYGNVGWYVIWEMLPSGDKGYDIAQVRSLDGGATWSDFRYVNSIDADNAANTRPDYTPAIASAGDLSIAVWASQDCLKRGAFFATCSVGYDADILFARRISGQMNWSWAQALVTSMQTDTAVDDAPAIATDGGQTWLVAWRHHDTSGPLGNDDDLLYSMSTDDGLTWSEALPLNTDAAEDTHADGPPQLAYMGDGNWLALWSANRDGQEHKLYYAKLQAETDTWTPPALFASPALPSVESDAVPSMAIDPETARFVAAWETTSNVDDLWGNDSDIAYTHRNLTYFDTPMDVEGEGQIDGEGSAEGEGALEGEGSIEGASEGEGEGDEEGSFEGTAEGEGAGDGEGSTEGTSEGEGEGAAEGSADGEGSTEGASEGEGQVDGEGNAEAENPSEGEGAAEGSAEGEGTLDGEGSIEGATEGEGQVDGEGNAEAETPGEGEGAAEGSAEGEGTLDGEGSIEGATEGEGQVEGEGNTEGEADGDEEGTFEGNAEGEGEGELLHPFVLLLYFFADLDSNSDHLLSFDEILALFQLFLADDFLLLDSNNDTRLNVAEILGQSPEHVLNSADSSGDFRIDLAELLRVIQLYNANGYECANAPGDTEDGFVPRSNPELEACLLHSLDRNADQRITLSELLRAIQLMNFRGYAYCGDLSEDGFCILE